MTGRPLLRFVGELALPVCLTAVSVYLWIVAGQITGGVGRQEPVGPDFLPRVLIAAIFVLSVAQVTRVAWQAVQAGTIGDSALPRIYWGRLLLAMLLCTAYAASLRHAGFLVSTAVFQAALLGLVFGYRDGRILLGVPLGLTALYGLIFIGLMNVPLPRGTGLFGDVSRLFY